MNTFSRGDYERAFRLALHMYNEHGSRNETLVELAIDVMDAVERCIGRIEYRPSISRRKGRNFKKD